MFEAKPQTFLKLLWVNTSEFYVILVHMNEYEKVARILRIEPEYLSSLDKEMSGRTGKDGVVDKLAQDIEKSISRSLENLRVSRSATADEVARALTEKIGENENELYKCIGITRENFDFERVKKTARSITSARDGFFLKKEKAREILEKSPPKGMLEYFGYSDIRELLKKQDIIEIISALRFTESNEWMHGAFDSAYSDFTPADFEHKEIELRAMGPQWFGIAEKFVAKKHHNVSHLKEFGIIFLNPINQTALGSLFRDFALFFHYFHEIAFYSKLFERHVKDAAFSQILKSLLRGDVPEKTSVLPGEWLIVQRYLWKEDLKDPRLLLPRVNPESLHWRKGESDLVVFGKSHPEISFEFWHDLDWVGDYFLNKAGEEVLLSFDLEDNAMSFVSAKNHEQARFLYHQQEALWNELFVRYVGEDARDKLIVKSFNKGYIKI